MLFCKALINGSGGLKLHTTLHFLHSGMVGNYSATGLDFFNQTQTCEKKQLQAAPRSVFCLHLIGMCTPKASESLTSKQQTRVISQNPSEKWSIHTISYMNIYIYTCRLYTVRISFTPSNFMEFLHLKLEGYHLAKGILPRPHQAILRDPSTGPHPTTSIPRKRATPSPEINGSSWRPKTTPIKCGVSAFIALCSVCCWWPRWWYWCWMAWSAKDTFHSGLHLGWLHRRSHSDSNRERYKDWDHRFSVSLRGICIFKFWFGLIWCERQPVKDLKVKIQMKLNFPLFLNSSYKFCEAIELWSCTAGGRAAPHTGADRDV